MVFLEQSLLGPTSCLEPKRGDLENFGSSTSKACGKENDREFGNRKFGHHFT